MPSMKYIIFTVCFSATVFAAPPYAPANTGRPCVEISDNFAHMDIDYKLKDGSITIGKLYLKNYNTPITVVYSNLFCGFREGDKYKIENTGQINDNCVFALYERAPGSYGCKCFKKSGHFYCEAR